MKWLRYSVLTLALLSFASCHSTKTAQSSVTKSIPSTERDGSTFEKAIVVKSIAEEYSWVRDHYPGSKFESQALIFQHEKPYDVLTFNLADGNKQKIYFDISGFFGKF